MALTDVSRTNLIEKVAEELKNVPEIQPPKWAEFVKTGAHKERPPMRDDWWYVRTAAILVKLEKLGPIGVSKLRIQYGGKKNRGHKPSKFIKGSGNIIRKAFQQLEKAGLIKKVDKTNTKKGRIIAPKGLSLLGKMNTLLLKNG